MTKKEVSKRESSKEKLLIGLLLFLLPSGTRAIGLDLGVFDLFLGALSLVGLVLFIIGVIGMIKNPKK